LKRSLLVLVIALAACVRPAPVMDTTSASPLPAASYIEAAEDGRDVYRILAQESLLLVRVGRAGRMQRFGHEHAVASEDLQGFVEIDVGLTVSRADVVFPLHDLVVDKAEYRERLQLDSEPSADDIAGTYANMLRVLDAAQYPWVEIRAGIESGPPEQPRLRVAIVLQGQTFELLVPARLEIGGDHIIVSGNAVIRHSDFDLQPFSALGGLLQVADELAVDFRVVGERMIQPGQTPGR